MEDLLKTLGTGAHVITFVKKNGKVRTILGSRDKHNQELVPKTSKEPHIASPTLIPVYDLEEEHWKSFYADKLISIL